MRNKRRERVCVVIETGSHITQLTAAQQIEYNRLDTTINTLYAP